MAPSTTHHLSGTSVDLGFPQVSTVDTWRRSRTANVDDLGAL